MRLRWAAVAVTFALVALNFIAYRHAYAMTHFAPGGRRTPGIERLGTSQRLQVLLTGAVVPRPANTRTPTDVGLAFERHVFSGARGLPLEAWLIPRADARAVIAMFHGHADSKDSLLPAARVLHSLGYAPFLVDFHGSGGSGGAETSIGFHEADDVAAALSYARGLPGSPRVVLYGNSMGAAAVLKAVGDRRLAPDAIVLECPFDRLASTVRHRFRTFGLPSFPAADALLFWGGVQQGFNPWRFNPVDSAGGVSSPTLLMNGGRDPWVSEREARAIYQRLGGPKRLQIFPELGHQSFLRARRSEWVAVVTEFLAAHAQPRSPRH